MNENGANEIDDGTLGLFPLPKHWSTIFCGIIYIRENLYFLIYFNKERCVLTMMNYCKILSLLVNLLLLILQKDLEHRKVLYLFTQEVIFRQIFVLK